MRDSSEPLPQVEALKWNDDGLVPAIVQDVETGDVLMMAWMDEPALRATIATGQTHFYSRSRRSHWHKGGTSGHVQHVESIWVDCDGDVVLIKARQVGAPATRAIGRASSGGWAPKGGRSPPGRSSMRRRSTGRASPMQNTTQNRLAGTSREMPD